MGMAYNLATEQPFYLGCHFRGQTYWYGSQESAKRICWQSLLWCDRNLVEKADSSLFGSQSFLSYLLFLHFLLFFPSFSCCGLLPPASFVDELDDLMRPLSPPLLEDTPNTDTVAAVQPDSTTIDTVISSSIGPTHNEHNEQAYAHHLTKQNKLNPTQCVLLNKLTHVCLYLTFPSFFLDVF